MLVRALACEGATADQEAVTFLADRAGGDARSALTAREVAQAVVHLATGPKSNRAAVGLWRAQADVRDLLHGEVPAHLRDAHHRSAESLGHGVGYDYPHDDPRAWVPQQYRPEAVAGPRYYEPSAHGFEAQIGARMAGGSHDTTGAGVAPRERLADQVGEEDR